MTILHHPSLETLARFAAGTLGAGPALVISAHLDGCAACRSNLGKLEAVGGVLLQEAPPMSMSSDALESALASIERPVAPPVPRAAKRFLPDLPGSITVPRRLRDRDVGRWRWLAPGVRWSRVAVPEDKENLVFLIRVAPKKKLPEHGHIGLEFTHVLSGSFHDAQGHYFPGDTLEADAGIDHQPIADAGQECICLAAVEGAIRLRGLVGHVLRPFIGV